ncbi:YibE/F family protein [Nocardioides silvaticus]|uniref:YibE/F family protein n=1 Tax=Nocardioides silvaticus TaxID=2201891 RepID=A0A316TBK2_9ACTN|nr:YibE/F family protein [Nocardioides silvaticus]PWN00891.1 YibE/F family protein [Nocardioides silvaticus]
MGHRHAHRAGGADDVIEVRTPTRVGLLVGLALAGVATVVGIVVWWPSGEESAVGSASYAADGATFEHGVVRAVGEPCPVQEAPSEGCGLVTVEVDERRARVQVPPEVLEAGLAPGDSVELLKNPVGEGGAPVYSYFATDRDGTLVWLLVVFLAVVVVVGRQRGLFALASLTFGASVVWWFLVPALMGGAPGIGVALAGSSAIMYVVLYLTHGLSLRTSTALAGTLVGIAITAVLAAVAVDDARLTGISDDASSLLRGFDDGLDFPSLLGCALVIAGLGVLNDVTITQASAVWELRAASPSATRREVYAGAMRIGRDHIASTIYTIVFAYVGTALFVLMLLSVYDRSIVELRSTEQLAEEIVRTLVTSIGLVLAVPVTTAIGALIAGPTRPAPPPSPAPG